MYITRGCRILGAAALFMCVVAQNQCYYPNGDAAAMTDFAPCNSNSSAVSMCCDWPNGDRCTEDGICMSGSNAYYRDSCTDQTWVAPECVQLCTDITSPQLTKCSDGSYCCGASNSTCCDAGEGKELLATRSGTVALSITVHDTSTSSAAPVTTAASGVPCYQDNCFRAMQREGGVTATPFCQSFTASVVTSTAALPTYASMCDYAVSEVSSACSCVVATTSSAAGATTTASSTSGASTASGSSAPSSKSTNGKSNNSVAIAAGVAVTIGVLLIALAVALFFWRRSVNKNKKLIAVGGAENIETSDKKDPTVTSRQSSEYPLTTRHTSSGLEDGSVMARLATPSTEDQSPRNARKGSQVNSFGGGIHEMGQSTNGTFHELEADGIASPSSREYYHGGELSATETQFGSPRSRNFQELSAVDKKFGSPHSIEKF